MAQTSGAECTSLGFVLRPDLSFYSMYVLMDMHTGISRHLTR